MTAGRSSRWIRRLKKISTPSAEPGQELGTSQQESEDVREGCASDLWVVHDPTGRRGQERE